MFDEPRPWSGFWLGVVGVLLLWGGGQVARLGMPELAALMGGLSLVCGVFAIGFVLAWGRHELIELMERLREIGTVTPTLRVLQAAARLTPEQTQVVPKLQMAGVAFDAAKDDMIAYLITPGGLVKFDLVDKFLRLSSGVEVYPVNRTSDKTEEREAIQLFTEWLVWQGYATPAAGPHPARWVEPVKSRVNAAARLHVDLLENLA